MSTVFQVILEGSQEVPSNGSTASGFGTVIFDSDAVAASYSFDIEGLDFGPITSGGAPTDPNDVTNTHFHAEDRGAAGGVVFGQIVPAHDNDDIEFVLNGDGSWSESGRWETTDPVSITSFNAFLGDTFASVLDSAAVGSDVPLYFNVHTVQFAGGEIRGQLVAIADDIDNVETGTTEDDRIRGGNGNDAIQGLAGDDKVRGFNGNDVLDGGSGDDRLAGGNGDDILEGSVGDDTLNGANGNDEASGGAGDDRIHGGNGDDVLSGGDGDDHIRTARGDDSASGGAGDDFLGGGRGDDALSGDAGDDFLVGRRGDDELEGGAGNDVLRGGRGDDLLIGGEGQDRLKGGEGLDIFAFADGDTVAGPGRDRVNDFEQGSDLVDAGGADWTQAFVGANTLVTFSGAVTGEVLFNGHIDFTAADFTA